MFITQIIDKNGSANVVESIIYSIKWAHKLSGLSDPTENHYVINLFETAKRHCSKRPCVKKAVVSSDQIIELCDKYEHTDDIFVIRDLCIIVLCFAGFLRFDEISSLLCKDIIFYDTYF